MPVPVPVTQLAASPGYDKKRDTARREVAVDFFQKHIFESDPEDRRDWQIVQRALQVVNFQRPVSLGPMPAAPRRLVAIAHKSPLGPGFFSVVPAEGVEPDWWLVSPEAIYMKYVAHALPSADPKKTPEPIRYFIPAARSGKDSKLVWRDRAK